MSVARLVWRMLMTRGMTHVLTAAIIALGVGLMLSSQAVAQAAHSALSAVAARFPVVVGGKIGAVPLVLGSFTRLQDLSGGVDASLYDNLRADQRVDVVVPLLGGHAVQGFPLLATSPEYLQPRSSFPLASGRVFDPGAMEVVLGSTAAKGIGASLGNILPIEHQHPLPAEKSTTGGPTASGLKVVGILKETKSDADQTLFCPIAAIHRSHATPFPDLSNAHAPHGDAQISSLLIRPKDQASLLALHDQLAKRPDIEVALTGQTLRRIADQLTIGGKLLGVVISGVLLITVLSLFLSVYGNSLAQAHEIAIMRMLGARRWQVVLVVLLAVLAVVGSGALGGLAVASFLGDAAERSIRTDLGLQAHVTLLSRSTFTYLAGLVVMLLAIGAQPALAAYHLEAAEALAKPAGSGDTSRRYFRWSLRIAVPIVVFVWAQNAMTLHSGESHSSPLDSTSASVYRTLENWRDGPPPPEVMALDNTSLSVQGYMYAVGDPFVVRDFYLVAMNPRLPRCPFCYRAPTARERILVRTSGREFDLAPGLITVSGFFHVASSAQDPYAIDLRSLDVVLP